MIVDKYFNIYLIAFNKRHNSFSQGLFNSLLSWWLVKPQVFVKSLKTVFRNALSFLELIELILFSLNLGLELGEWIFFQLLLWSSLFVLLCGRSLILWKFCFLFLEIFNFLPNRIGLFH